jgi:tryptophan-rich sensory protein
MFSIEKTFMFRPIWTLYLAELFLLPASFDRQWYDSLQKPWFQPPSYLFGLAWGLLYPLLAYAYYLLLQQNDPRLLALFETQLALNLVWSYVFFTMKNIKLASVTLVAMILLNVSLRMEKWYFLYTGWLCFALILNLSVRE